MINRMLNEKRNIHPKMDRRPNALVFLGVINFTNCIKTFKY